ncbi:MAG TPA: hypothetical protein VJ749_17120 [Pyrinomonadaceae bacterium]|nr:hypothetical protein [Pyrinomonadaceae bacterium]
MLIVADRIAKLDQVDRALSRRSGVEVEIIDIQYQILNLSHGSVMTLVMLKQTAKPKSLNEIVIRFFLRGMMETDSRAA